MLGLKIFVMLVGIVFLAAMAHEGVHIVQMKMSGITEPTVLAINLEPNPLARAAWVEWKFKEEVPYAEKERFREGLPMLEIPAYAIFFAVIGGLLYALRKEICCIQM